MDIVAQLVERFFRYVAVSSQSDARATNLPSTEGQRQLAELLSEELRELGLDDVVLDEHAILTARRAGNQPGAPTIGFIAHLDTADVGLSPVIRPQVLRFEGSDLCLNRDRDVWLRVAEHSDILPYTGEDIIFGDGTSVLGADNKAAIAVLMTLLANLQRSSSDPSSHTGSDESKDQSIQDSDGMAHGDIVIAFVPDEEIGLLGAKALDLKRFACDFAYTIDATSLGEVVIETFNAASAEIVFTGVSAHPMAAKGVMVNPLLMAHDFIAQFDRRETPENTEGRSG